MNILVTHQNFPGQYKHLLQYLAVRHHTIKFITQRPNIAIPGVERLVYKAKRGVTPHIHPYLEATLQLPEGGPLLRTGDEVVTYVARSLEPYRGFPSFMRSLPAILHHNRHEAQTLERV